MLRSVLGRKTRDSGKSYEKLEISKSIDPTQIVTNPIWLKHNCNTRNQHFLIVLDLLFQSTKELKFLAWRKLVKIEFKISQIWLNLSRKFSIFFQMRKVTFLMLFFTLINFYFMIYTSKMPGSAEKTSLKLHKILRMFKKCRFHANPE